MTTVVDTGGLSFPQPVLLPREALQESEKAVNMNDGQIRLTALASAAG